MPSPITCLSIAPGASHFDIRLGFFANASVETMLEALAELNEHKPVAPHDLLGFQHDDHLWLGIATDEHPTVAVRLCPEHHLSIRGPTIIIPLNSDRENHRCALRDASTLRRPPLDSIERATVIGPGNCELQPFSEPLTESTLFPLADGEVQLSPGAGDLKGLEGIISNLLRPRAGWAPLLKTIFDKRPPEELKNSPHRFAFEVPAICYIEHRDGLPQFKQLVACAASFYLEELKHKRETGVLAEAEALVEIKEVQQFLDLIKAIPTRTDCYIITQEDMQ